MGRYFRVGSLLTVTLLLTTMATPSAPAATLAGSKCSKAGNTKVVSNIKYTCVKSGKKVIWNKGVKVATPRPELPAPSQTSAPKPTPTPSPTFTPPTAPTSFDDLIENFKGIAYAAWSKSRAKIASSTAVAKNFNLHIGQNTVIPNKNPQIAYDLIAKLYEGFTPPKKIELLAFGWDDRDWAEAKMKEIMPSAEWRWLKFTACATKETCWGGGAFTDNEGTFLLVITTQVIDDNHTSGTLEAHEYTHGIQQAQFGKPQPWPPVGNWPPTWIIEGQAEFSQTAAIFNTSYQDYLANRYAVSQNLFKNPAYDSKFLEKYFQVNPPSSWYTEHDRWLQYDAGGMFVEILAALKGPDSVMELWRKMGSGKSFHEAFKEIYGRNFDDVLPIVSKAIALELGKS